MPPIYGAGGLIDLNEAHSIPFKARLRGNSNNYTELLPLKLLLKLTADNEVTKLQVFGDFLVIINWMKWKIWC